MILATLAVGGVVRADLKRMALAPGDMPQALYIDPAVSDSSRVPPDASYASPLALDGEVSSGGMDRGHSLPTSYLPTVLDTLPAGFWPEQVWEGERIVETPPVNVLADRQSSLALCLYGLVGLGAFRSFSCMRKLPFAAIPDWYQSGGPAEVGHSLALAPDCLAWTAVCCLVQPAPPALDRIPRYGEGTTESLWRKSQLTSTTLAARGPPHLA